MASLRPDVRRLDDRPPLFDLGLLLCGKRLRGLLVARPDFLTHVGKAPAHRWVGQALHDRGMKGSEDILRRALGCPQSMPEGCVKSRYPGLVDRRRIGRRSPSGL